MSRYTEGLRGTGSKDFTTLETDIEGIKTQTDKLQFDASNNLKVTSGTRAKDTQSVLSNATINASSSNISSSIDVTNYDYLIVTLRATMNASATADPAASVDILTSQDNSNFDSSGYAYVTALTLPLSAGNTRQKTSNLIDLRGINYIKIETKNEDSAQSLTGVYVDIVKVRVGGV